jgi:hypothetical protein
MNDTIKLFSEILSLSGCICLIFCVYISFRIERFIVKRYEQETDLLDTVFFREHATFVQYIPDFFSSALYNAHLLMCVWGWWLYQNRKMFRDIDNPKNVTQHFSAKEIRKTKWFLISGLSFFLHGAAYLIFRLIWPDAFD